jgi:hypothetical protein
MFMSIDSDPHQSSLKHQPFGIMIVQQPNHTCSERKREKKGLISASLEGSLPVLRGLLHFDLDRRDVSNVCSFSE